MNPQEQEQFWLLYNRKARPAIERACRSTSRLRTDSGMDDCDMIAWVDDKVWRMLETDAWPAFHDDPTPEIAAERLQSAAGLLARWSYLGLCRKYWRRVLRQPMESTQHGISRVERLACAQSSGEHIELSENIAADLERIRTAISERVRGKLAASWPEQSERHQMALLLNAHSSETDELIERSVGNEMKPNTLLQMRSRSRKHIRQAIQTCASVVCVAAVFICVSVAKADGEQSGGRKGRIAAMPSELASTEVPLVELMSLEPYANRANGGEQTGGRGG